MTRAPIHEAIFQSHYTRIGIVFRTAVKLWLTLSWVAYTMNIAWKQSLREFLRSTAYYREMGWIE